jgi:hypothetical protein
VFSSHRLWPGGLVQALAANLKGGFEMTEYTIHGPFKVPFVIKPAARSVRVPRDFWNQDEASKLRDRCGVYVLGMRAGRGIVPYYVGKTTNSFEKECFQPTKLLKYDDALAEYRRGRPVIFFIARPVRRGQVKGKEIKQIEDFLIQVASAKNPELLNIKGKNKPKWAIAGVIRGTAGQPSTEAKEFRGMMGLQRRFAG